MAEVLAEMAVIVGKIVVTIGALLVFIVGLLAAVEPADVGIRILQALNVTSPSPLIGQAIIELQIAGAVFSITGVIVFLLSMFYLWRH